MRASKENSKMILVKNVRPEVYADKMMENVN
jgi:hypothetical protein